MKISHKTALDIVKEMTLETMREGDVTVKMVAEQWQVSQDAARSKLDRLVKDGVLIKFKGIFWSGGRGMIYRAVEEEQLGESGD